MKTPTALLATILACYANYSTADDPVAVDVAWNDAIIDLRTTPTLQVVVNQKLLPDSDIRENALESLRLVSADYVRFVPWYPYPKLSVPELDPPVRNGDECSTSWNFTYMDLTMADFYSSTPNVSHIINFSTSPDWMWITDTPYTYPENVTETQFTYNNGTQLKDASLKDISDYFARIYAWYAAGGFTDECGVYHESGHHYDIEYWEVLNEMEHDLSPAFYNQLYDSITAAIQPYAQPNLKFVGLGGPASVDYFSSFFNASNHREDVPMEMVSAHYYAYPSVDTTENEATSCFNMIDSYIETFTKPIIQYRDQLAPSTKITYNEVGTFDPQGMRDIIPGYTVPDKYFVWSGGAYAYFYCKAAAMGIDAVGESQLIGFPGQYPSVSMVDWNTGLPNARLRVLQMIQQTLTIGDSIVSTTSSDDSILFAQGFSDANGKKKIVLVNKTDQSVQAQVNGWENGEAEIVDESTGGNVWRTENVDGQILTVPAYATIVLQS